MMQLASEKIKDFEIDRTPGLMLRLGSKFACDQYHFIKKDISSVSFMTGLHKDYHTTRDTPDKINYQNATKITQLVFLTTWQLANYKN